MDLHLQGSAKTVVAATQVANSMPPARPVGEVIRDLASKKPAIRASAQSELAAMGPAATEALMQALEVEGRTFRQQCVTKRRCAVIGGGAVLALVGSCVVLGLTTGHWEMMSNFASFGGVFGAMGAAAVMSPQHKSIVSLIANLDDVRSVGWLVDALQTEDKTIRPSVEQALIRLLPRLSVSESILLDEERRRILDKRLIKTDSGELAAAIVLAYDRFGDSKSLESVLAVAEGRGAFSFTIRIRDAARQAAESIRARAEKEHQAQVLLRPIEDSAGSATLLRPMEGVGDMQEEVLLRPASSNNPT